MSGTSMDGISAAVVRFSMRRKAKIQLLSFHTIPYSRSVREMLLGLRNASTEEICRANFRLGDLMASAALSAIRLAGLTPVDVRVIGSHGHTISHQPHGRPPSTLQIGEPSVIAERTGVTTVADFRCRDIACGGEGAPLVPHFDFILFGGRAPVVLQNIGGIGNLAVVGKREEETIAFDTGPGNCLIDAAVRIITKGEKSFDANGKLARAGVVDERLLRKMLADPYFRKVPPKSTDIAHFGEGFVRRFCGRLLKRDPASAVATLTRLTARSIAVGYRKFIPSSPRPARWIVSGGGALNPVLMKFLAEELCPIPVLSISAYGLHPLAKEPAAFAYFACETAMGVPNNSPSATGAKRRAILGKIIPGANYRRTEVFTGKT